MSERVLLPTAAHQQFRDDLVEVLRKHAAHIDAKEMLAVASYVVGQIVAMQDQRTVTPELAIAIICRNIEEGNAQTVQTLRGADIPKQ